MTHFASPYDKLITPSRLRVSTSVGRDLETEMLSDKARVVASSAFRRLQVKAQVFSLEENAGVRTRLTHTLEVAMYGELIAGKTFTLLLKANRIDESLRLAFITAVENACLLHDMGNPPFGHLGEFAIRDWFSSHKAEILDCWRKAGVTAEDAERHFHAFERFDGNPQGLRIVSKLQWLRDPFGLNLTCTLLATMVKYLHSAPQPGKPFGKKAGFFETEREVVLEVWRQLGLKISGDSLGQRHPLTFLMEAADDISYCLSDIEDAIEKRVVTESEFIHALPNNLAGFVSKDPPDIGEALELSKDARFISFRTNLTRNLVESAAKAFVQHEEEIIGGTFTQSLLDVDSFASESLKWLKKFSKEHIFSSREAVNIELSGFKVVHGILDGFRRLIVTPPSDFAKLLPNAKIKPEYGQMPLESRLFSLLPNKHRITYSHHSRQNPILEAVFRTHLILDYLAGMTDSHAVKVYRMLNGISTGM